MTNPNTGDPDVDEYLMDKYGGLTESAYVVVIKHNKAHIDDFHEIDGLKSKGVFIDVHRGGFSKQELRNMLVIRAKLILAIKEPREPDERKKARTVAQAIKSKDWDKRMLNDILPNCESKHHKIHAKCCCRKNNAYIYKGYQSSLCLNGNKTTKIYLILPKELGYDPNILWLVEKPLYRLPENGVHWFETYTAHQKDLLSMSASAIDPCSLYRPDGDKKLDGLKCL